MIYIIRSIYGENLGYVSTREEAEKIREYLPSMFTWEPLDVLEAPRY
jgi:hypothetical protein